MVEDNRGKLASTIFALAGVGGHLVLMLLGSVALFATGISPSVRMLQEGGWMAYVLIAASMLSVLLLAGIGIWFARSEKSWAWTPVVPPVLVMLLASVGVMIASSKMRSVLDLGSVAPSQKASIFAQGLAESLTLTSIGALAAMFLASAATTIPAARALSRVGKKRLGAASGIAAGVGLLTFVLTVGAYFVWPAWRGVPPLAWLPAFNGVICVTVAALSLTGPREGLDNPAGALGDLLMCAGLTVLGVGLAATGVRSIGLMRGFAALAGASDGRAELLEALWAEAAHGSYAMWIYALPVCLAVLGPIAVRAVLLGRAMVRVMGGLVAIPLGVGVTFGLPMLQMTRLSAAMQEFMQVTVPSGVDLALVPSTEALRGPDGTQLWVGKQTILLEERELREMDLSTEDECQKVVREIRRDRAYTRSFAIGTDESTPYRSMECLARGLSRDDSKAPSGRKRRVVWMVQRPPRAGSNESSVEAVAGGHGSIKGSPEVRVHVSDKVQVLDKGSSQPKGVKGSQEEVA
ncbi:MAG: hypothetical protein ACOC1F_03400, partial [Myxococcota bacterium]